MMTSPPDHDTLDLKPLPIVWQRLVNRHGETCVRCAATRLELERAFAVLQPGLRPFGIAPELEFREVDEQAFATDPSESNRIWIAGRPLESWLGGDVGQSPCCAVCGGSQCRTVRVGDVSFETVPAQLISKAALLASAELVCDPASIAG